MATWFSYFSYQLTWAITWHARIVFFDNLILIIYSWAISKGYYPFPAICGFALFADLVLHLTLTLEHPSHVVNKF